MPRPPGSRPPGRLARRWQVEDLQALVDALRNINTDEFIEADAAEQNTFYGLDISALREALLDESDRSSPAQAVEVTLCQDGEPVTAVILLKYT